MRCRLTGRRRRGTVLAGTLAVAALLTACSGSASPDSATVRFGVFSWNAARVTTHILIDITRQYPQLGVDDVETVDLGTTAGWVGLGEDDVDVLTEVAWPNQQPLYQKNKAATTLLSKTYDHAAQGWFVPSYVVESGGPAPDLESVTQLDQYKQVFGGKLYDAQAGWVTTEWNTARLKAYGIGYEQVNSSESALLAQVKKSYEARKPIVFYLWHPHWAFAEYDFTQLKEPQPYKEGCFEKEMGPCAMPDYSAYIAGRKDLKEKAPKFYAFLQEFRLDVPKLEKMLAETSVRGKPVEQVAKEWVNSHKSQIDSWVQKSTKSKS